MENRTLIDNALKQELSTLYGDAGRHYHGIAHLNALLALANEYRPALADPEAVEAAIWFHDAVYDSRAKDNEAQSAALAREKLGGRIEPRRLDRIAAMIEATATHRLPDFTDADASRDAAFFLDMDLSILGAPPELFAVYGDAVRQEYAWVQEPAWNAGRAAVLKNFLARRHIFYTPEFRNRFESQAKKNIAAALTALERQAQSGFSA
jgi:predicted metal-dependent HD superfamily phosphohydrolase